MVFQFMRDVTFYTFSLLDSACTSYMSLFPTIFALRNTWIHIYTSNSSNIATNFDASINETFSFDTRLNVPDVNSNNRHIRFWESFDNSQS